MEYSQQYLKRRKFMLPLIVLPFVTVVFWLLGGGSGVVANAAPVARGLNTSLPDSKVAGSMVDKMSFYAMADRDSVKRVEQKRMDPNYGSAVSVGSSGSGAVTKSKGLNGSFGGRSVVDAEEEKINARLQVLQSSLREPERKVVPVSEFVSPVEVAASAAQRQSDPEMDAINTTLEKLLDVQHPERVKERFVEKKAVGFAVRVRGGGSSDFFGRVDTSRGGFLGDDDAKDFSNDPGVIAAAVHGEQVVKSGAFVKMRLLRDVFVNGVQIPAGSFVYGAAELQNERLHLIISSIQYEKHLFPVALRVYDMDGVEGLNAPGSVTREVVKQSGEQAAQSIGIVNMDPSLKAQATAAGIGAAKSLLTKRVKAVQVTVKANYNVLLKDENAKEK